MAFVEKRGNRFRIIFRYDSQRYTHTLRTTDPREAEALKGGIEKVLMRLEQHLLELPEGADLLTFVLSDGKTAGTRRPVKPVTLEELFKEYLAKIPEGSMEENSLDTIGLHIKHVKRLIGANFLARDLTAAVLQDYVRARSKEKSRRGHPISPVTIRKEVTSFSGIWNWGVQMGLLTGAFPNRGLKYPKTEEKQPFQTLAEIERQAASGLSEAEQQELWDCLFLTLPEIQDLLAHVKQKALHPFLYPMFVFAAHTGARRSEMLRSERRDFDFASKTVVIREKKRVRGQRTTRRVPMSPLLAEVMQEWLARHPGGRFTFCHQEEVFRSRKRSRTTGYKGETTRTMADGRVGRPRSERPALGALTRDEANDHFKRTLAGSKWEVVRGYHVLRHSFASNCAARGVDQRLINAWMGHQTEEMVKRYRHLVPDQQQLAIQTVFGSAEPHAAAVGQ